MTSLPAARPRVALPEISAAAWEHPADRAALQALRSVPGVDEVIRKILGMLGGERGIRLLFQGNAVRVGPTQFPLLWALHVENCSTFGWETIPELYVTQTPIFNAGAYGIDNPFIVIHSSALELLDTDEQRVLLAHELGHFAHQSAPNQLVLVIKGNDIIGHFFVRMGIGHGFYNGLFKPCRVDHFHFYFILGMPDAFFTGKWV